MPSNNSKASMIKVHEKLLTFESFKLFLLSLMT